MNPFRDSTPEGRFWRWFASVESRYQDHFFSVELSLELDRRLSEIHPRLGWGIGRSPGGAGSFLTLTANYDREAADVVRRLKAGAPELPGWTIEAFQGIFDVEALEENGYVWEGDLTFAPIGFREDGRLDLRVFVVRLEENRRNLTNGAWTMLQALLGEESYLFDLGEVEILAGSEADGRPIEELSRYLAESRANRGQPS